MPAFKSELLENKMIRGLIKGQGIDDTGNLGKAVAAGINLSSFTSDFKSWLFSYIKKYNEKYSTSATEDICFRQIAHKYAASSNQMHDNNAILKNILKVPFDNDEMDLIIDEIKNLAHLRTLQSLTIESVGLLEAMKSGKTEMNYRAILDKLNATSDKMELESSEERVIERDAFEDVKKDMDMLRDLREHPEKYRGITTGIEPLDRATNGWQPGDLATIIGRTGQGKSIVLLNFGAAAWLAGYNVYYVTIEMPFDQQVRRLFSKMTGAGYQKFKDPVSFTDEEMDAVETKINSLVGERDNVFQILDAPNLCTAKFIEKKITKWEKKTGKKIDLLIVDPIYLMKPNDPDEDDLVGAVSWDLKLLARKFHIPVLNANQINREGHKRHQSGKEIDAMDSASSDRLGQNSDIMLGIYSDGTLFVKMTLVKYRDGSGPPMYFRRNYDRMSLDYDKDFSGNIDANETLNPVPAGASSSDKNDSDGLD